MAFGVAGKKSGMTGADFSITYKENREKALSYLMDDLKAIKGLAERML
jgi:hypothetical protein